jgi:hypothetical protein
MECLTDKRRTYTFYVDDAVLDVFGPKIGAYGIAVYTLLARHAKHKQCFPSYRHIQKQLGLSRQTVWRTLELLVKEGLISREQRSSAHGDNDSNLYTLLDLSAHHVHEGSSSQEPPSSSQEPPGTPEEPGVVPHRNQGSSSQEPEGILIKGSHLKELNPPHSPPQGGELGVAEKTVATPRQKKKTRYPTAPEAQATLRTLVFDAAFDAWVREKGLTLDLSAEWERFGSKCLAKGYQYEDWRHAFMNWLTSPYQPKPACVVGTSKTMDPETFMAEMDKWKGRI